MRTPPDWSDEQLSVGRSKAIGLFRQERMEEPLEAYLGFFDEYQGTVEDLLETSVNLTQLDTKLKEIRIGQKLPEAFCSLAGPPISLDDLTTLAEAKLSRKSIQADSEMT